VSEDRTSALRPLQQAAESIAVLRQGTADESTLARAALDVISAVEWTLRRRLRDEPVVPLAVRLSSLAPDEMTAEQVLSELRQHDVITIQSAAAVHHLFEARERLASRNVANRADADQALMVVELLESELSRARAEVIPVHDTLLDEEIQEVPSPGSQHVSRRKMVIAASAVIFLLLTVVLVRWYSAPAGGAEMQQGIALFRSGAYADAAHHFYRYSQLNPDDATPHLYLARIHRRLGRPQLAGPALQEALRLAPEDPAVHRELGFLLLETGRSDVAVERFRSAVAMDSDSPEGWMGLVLALRRDGRPGEADRVLARAPVQVRERFERQPDPFQPSP
jgi:tetratricopeptide (TPR) repeat protein